MKNKIVFFGTSAFAADILSYLIAHQIPVVGIVTQPDRPKGRSLQMAGSPVKELGLELPLLQPEKASEESFLQELAALQADLYVVVAYGQILPQKLLSLAPLGCINVHASLLPKYRGAAPMQRCLMAGDTETGISIQKMVKQMDAGDVIATVKIEIPQNMTLGDLEKQLCEVAKPLLLQVICAYEQGIPEATPQEPSLVTFAAKITPEDGEIHWGDSAEKIHCLVRAFSPRPGAWTRAAPDGKRIKILRTRLVPEKQMRAENPGRILSKDGLVACGSGVLQLIEVQPDGKKVMGAVEWLRGVSGAPQFLASE